MDSPSENWSLERIGVNQANFILDKDKDLIKVGRDSRMNDKVFIRGNTVSRQHLKLQRRGRGEQETWTVTDNGSSNGTFVNQERIPPHQEVELKHGDILGIGEQEDTSRVSKEVVFRKESYVFKVVAPRARRVEGVVAPRARGREDDAKKKIETVKMRSPSPPQRALTPASTQRRPQDLTSERVWATIEPKKLNIQNENEPITPQHRSTPRQSQTPKMGQTQSYAEICKQGKMQKFEEKENSFEQKIEDKENSFEPKFEDRENSFEQAFEHKSFTREDLFNGYDSS